ncbi:MAG: isoprenylcysteine carboxylmethyltransferase family protein [Hyphomicrobiales bacterium]|nr:isoprenylcysteine carboxylmethyltransferase family protein [Hyphomicrobiales bacterium]
MDKAMDQSNEGKGEPGAAADIVIRPPTLFLGGLAAGSIVELFWPLGPGLAQGSWKPVVIGLFFAACGIAFSFRSVTALTNAGTDFKFEDGSSAVVKSGLYKLSRNPIYIGLVIAYFGLALALTSGWALIILPLCIAALNRGVIAREEEFLEAKFGDDYRAYRAKVPRWL